MIFATMRIVGSLQTPFWLGQRRENNRDGVRSNPMAISSKLTMGRASITFQGGWREGSQPNSETLAINRRWRTLAGNGGFILRRCL
jgi:hypothetical protein